MSTRWYSPRFIVSAAALAALVACADDGKGPEEDLPLFEGKSDSVQHPTDHGALALGASVAATLSDGERYHAWSFQLKKRTSVALRTGAEAPGGAEVDTVLYLYKQKPSGAFGDALAKNDDCTATTASSCLTRTLDPGTYRVLVKGYAKRDVGAFTLTSTCAGCTGGGGTPVVFHADLAAGTLPAGLDVFFTDYPTSEDAAAASPERQAKLAAVVASLTQELGRAPLLSEIAQRRLDDIIDAGWWLNARVEPVDATDAATALVFTHINRSDDTDTNVVFALDGARGVLPSTTYDVKATIVIRSNAPGGCFGVGGAPDSVRYSMTFSRTPITRVPDGGEHWRATNRAGLTRLPDGVEPYDPAQVAGDLTLGTIAAPNATDCDKFLANPFEDVTLTATTIATTDARGVLYTDLSTHSGFESVSVWGLKSVHLELTPR